MSATSKLSNGAVAKIAVKTFGRCAYCGKEINYENDYSLDHIKPLSRGGTNKNNLVLCCKECNNLKGSRTVEQFRNYLKTDITNELKNDIKFKSADSFGLVNLRTPKDVKFFFEILEEKKDFINTIFSACEEQTGVRY